MELRPKKIDLYIVTKFISTFFVALLLIIGIVIIFDIFSLSIVSVYVLKKI